MHFQPCLHKLNSNRPSQQPLGLLIPYDHWSDLMHKSQPLKTLERSIHLNGWPVSLCCTNALLPLNSNHRSREQHTLGECQLDRLLPVGRSVPLLKSLSLCVMFGNEIKINIRDLPFFIWWRGWAGYHQAFPLLLPIIPSPALQRHASGWSGLDLFAVTRGHEG